MALGSSEGWFSRLKNGLSRTRVNIVGLFSGGVVDEDFLEELEFALISADVGVETTTHILERLRSDIKLQGLKTQEEVKLALRDELVTILKPAEGVLNVDQAKPCVIMMCGVNGAGKTTSIGKSMKDAEFVCDCSDIDDVIVFTKDGRYVITKVSDKAFFEKGIYYIGVFKRNDERTIYNVLYRDGKNGPILMKRCAIKAITRDKEYDITKGTPKSEILYMSVNPNGEAEVLKVYFKPRPRLKKVIVDLDFSTLAIKGRQSQGNLFSRYGIHKIVLKERGTSTLGGQNVWFDEDVRRLNADGRGKLLGEFKGDDRIIVWTSKNQYYITGYDLGQHFPDETVRVSRYEPDRVYSVCYYDRSQQFYYMKRFTAEMSDKMQFFLDEDGQADLVAVTERTGAKLEITYKGAHASRPADEVDVDEFVGVKSHRAKGKRLTTYEVATLRFIEPELPPEPEPSDDGDAGEIPDGLLSGGGADDGAADAGAGDAAAVSGGVEFEIERARGDADEVIDPEQLNLF